MFDIPISALLVCYGPLFLTVVGFIVFAFLTDVNARRSYLRRNAGLDAGGKVQAPPVLTRAVTAETPAGGRVTIRPAQFTTPEITSGPVPSPAAPSLVASTPDNLTRLEGIGPKIAQALVDAGLDTFEKVAAASQEDFRVALTTAGVTLAPSMESWAEQASYAAKGDWDGLKALQDTLISGRYRSVTDGDNTPTE